MSHMFPSHANTASPGLTERTADVEDGKHSNLQMVRFYARKKPRKQIRMYFGLKEKKRNLRKLTEPMV